MGIVELQVDTHYPWCRRKDIAIRGMGPHDVTGGDVWVIAHAHLPIDRYVPLE